MTSSNYQHEHHAGNHGDVFKHTVFVTVIQKMQALHPTGICFVDTHAGAGIYDLSEQKQRAEYQKGITKVIDNKEKAPKCVQDYIKASLGWSTTVDEIEYYPGSPVLGQKLLRTVDEHRLADLNVSAMQGLKEKQSHFEQLDAFDPQSLHYFLSSNNDKKHPVVLIDPAYQDNDDYGRAKDLLENILDKEPTATVLVWVPLIHGSRYRFSALKMLKEVASAKAALGQYTATCSVGATPLLGSAVFVANPPGDLDLAIGDPELDWLARTMTTGRGEHSVEQKMKKKKTAA